MILSTILLFLFSSLGTQTTFAGPVNYCTTSACNHAADYIRNALDTTANPCNDFYQYACGGWVEKNLVPLSKSRLTSFDVLNDHMIDQVRHLLDSFVDDKVESLATSSYAVRFAKRLYSASLNTLGDPVDAFIYLKEMFHYDPMGWLIGQDHSSPFRWHESYVEALSNLGVKAVFDFGVQPDPKNVTKNIITLDPMSLGLGDNELKNLTANKKVVDAYRKYISKSGEMFCSGHCPKLSHDVEEIVQLESKLAKVKMSVEDQRDPHKMYNKLTFGELHNLTNFDWVSKVLNPLLDNMQVSYRLTPNDHVLVSDIEYVVKALQILHQTDSHTFANYVGWRVASTYGPYSTELFRMYEFDFLHAKTGVKIIPERWRASFSLVNSHLSFALSKLFVEHHFGEVEHIAAKVLIDQIHEAFQQLVTENQWLDSSMKSASLDKLRHVHKNVGYPLWVVNSTDLDKFYGLDHFLFAAQLLEDKNYLLALASFTVRQDRNNFEKLHQPIDIDHNWPMPPAIVNAAYDPTQNSITIPAGILKLPFFDVDRPFSINFGGIGVVIGHEFTHGLDDEGRQFDKFGNLNNWWNNETLEHFKNRSECFVKQYSSHQDPVTKLHLNGRHTLGENIADNGGLHEAYRAFQNFVKVNGPSPLLHALPHLSSEQLFFISYAHTWCSNILPEALKLQIEYDPHSPTRYRVNVPVSNSVDFAKAFQCPVGSPMNPKDKCHLW